MQRVLVTGASGFIGRHLVASLTRQGVAVVALGRTPIDDAPASVRVHRGDLTKPETVRGAAAGCDTIIHLAGLTHRMGGGSAPPSEADYDRVNVGGARTVIDEARHSGVARLLFMSSTSAVARHSDVPLTETSEPRPADAYGRSKLRAEAVVGEAGARGDLWTATLRPPMVYGPGNRGNLPRLMQLVRAGVPLPLGAVHNARSVLYIGNLLHAVQCLLARQPVSGSVYFAADANPLSTPQLIRIIGEAVHRPPRLVPVPVWMLRALGRLGDVAARAIAIPFTSQEIIRLTGSLAVDDRRLRADTGYAPPFTTREGVALMAGSAGTRSPG